MLRRAASQLTYANVVSTVCLFILLGGSAYAATQVSGSDIRNNTLQSRDVKNDSIRTQDIKENTIKGIDVRNGTLLARDFAPGQLPPGATGPAGPRGPAGKDGKDGAGGTGGGGAAVVDRTRLAAPLTAAADNQSEAVPLTGNSWTQAADETDQFLGVASVTPEAGCAVMDASANVNVFVSHDGGAPQLVGNAEIFGSGTRAVSFNLPVLFEPGTATTNEFSATFTSSCDDSTKRYTLDDLKINVVSFR